MSVLQRMQEETAQLHRRFLEGQEQAGRTIQSLIEQQGRILQGGTPLSAQQSHPSPTAPVLATAAPAAPLSRPPATAVPPATPAPAAADRVTETLLAVVSEKTGYPVEMLELEMGMDSDLGIDSIKRVEILSALQERLPGSPGHRPRAPRLTADPGRDRTVPGRRRGTIDGAFHVNLSAQR